jgi:uncharacterized membrane protein
MHPITAFIGRRWIWFFAVVFGLYVWLPFLAPLLMQIGWSGLGRLIYLVYSFLCHQLPQRSLFFFGAKTMYSLPEIQAAWKDSIDPMILRQFIGNTQMGWKLGWSDRMISMFTSLWFFGLLWWPLRRRIPSLPWWGLIILILPLALDGTSHFIGDLAGLGQGFRDSNIWLATLTNHAFSPLFYAGDALGSFNSWMRWITGVLFGLGLVWFGFPYLDEALSGLS